MRFRLSETTCDKKYRVTIEQNLSKNNSRYKSEELIDEIPSFYINLQVPLKVKGSTFHVSVKTVLKIKDRGEKMIIAISSNMMKPMLLSAFFGFAFSLLFSVTHWSLLLLIIAGITVSSISFGLFYARIKKTSRLYLLGLKEECLL